MGFIKSTNHRPTHHQRLTQRLTDPPTHRPSTHQHTDTIIIFKILGNRKIFILQNTHTTEKIISVYYPLYLTNMLCLHNFEVLQKKINKLMKKRKKKKKKKLMKYIF